MSSQQASSSRRLASRSVMHGAKLLIIGVPDLITAGSRAPVLADERVHDRLCFADADHQVRRADHRSVCSSRSS